MNKLYRAAYGNESRIMFISAPGLKQAIELANTKVKQDIEWEEGDELPFVFDKDSVNIVNTSKSEILDDIKL